MFLGGALTDQEIAAVKAMNFERVAAKGMDAAGKLLESFGTETPKGKTQPGVADLVQKMTLLAKAVEFGEDTSVFAENFKGLYSLGANVRGFLESGVVTHPEAADALIFIDCAPSDFGLTENATKRVLLASNACEGSFDVILPITAWAEREGTYTGVFSGARLPVRMGPLPPEGARSLRWVLTVL